MTKFLATALALAMLTVGLASAEAATFGYGFYSHQTATGGASGSPNQGG